MTDKIESMLDALESGRLTRRQFAVSVAALAASAVGAPGARAAIPKKGGPRAVSINHITVRVPDIYRTARFYQDFFGMPLMQQGAGVLILGVENSFFGIEQSVTGAATVDHFDFGIANFKADETRALLREHNLQPLDKTSQESFKFRDPDGFLVQVNGPDYGGHVK